MTADFQRLISVYADVIVRIGVNLQPGQKLLIAEPYELQGVARSVEPVVRAIANAIGAEPEVIWGDTQRLRDFAQRGDWLGFERLVAGNAQRMQQHLASGGAFLFLVGSQPQMMNGVAAERISELHQISWRHFGPIAQKLTRGASQWTLAPAPSSEWADVVYADLPSEHRLSALWDTVMDYCRCRTPDPLGAWRAHLATLASRRDELNAQRHTRMRYEAEGTSLTASLPAKHVWCTAQMTTRAGVSFVANLPTEEIFTAPDKNSTEGRVRIVRPVSHGGAVIDGIELEFKRGRVVASHARTGADLLTRLLEADDGAPRLGEVAIVPANSALGQSSRLFYHTLLDENAANHIALGDAYRFCNKSLFPFALNSSLVHVDLPVGGKVTLT